MPFMEFLLSRIQPGGDLTIATNERFYCDEAMGSMGELWGWSHCQLNSCRDLFHHHPRTHFERKYLSRGEDCFNMVFKNPQGENRDGGDFRSSFGAQAKARTQE